MRYLWLFGFMILGLVSCVKDITLDAMEEPQLVVECVLSNEPVQTLYLSFTKGASQSESSDISEATAVLTDLSEGKEVGQFTRRAKDKWQLEYTGIPAHRYRLDVKISGHDPVWAEQTMPEEPAIEVHWDWWRKNLSEEERYRNSHGYIFSTDTLHAPVWFYGINQNNDTSTKEMTEYLCTDYQEVDRFNAVPTAFNAYDEDKLWGCWFRTSTYPDLYGEPYHRHYLRFPIRIADKTEFQIAGDFHNNLINPKDFVRSKKQFAELHYFSASEEYDTYLMDSYLFEQKSNSSNLSAIFLRDNLYSNIHGAIGIFGAKNERSLRWDDDCFWGYDGPFYLSGLSYYDQTAFPYANHAGYREVVLYPPFCDLPHKPFSFLLYEVREGHPEEWKYGVKTGPSAIAYRIESVEQLLEHGITDHHSIDFSTQSIWAFYAAFHCYHLPLLVAQLEYEKRTEGQEPIYVLYQYLDYLLDDSTPIRHDTSSRVVIVMDKIDEESFSLARYEFIWGMYNSSVSLLGVMNQLDIN